MSRYKHHAWTGISSAVTAGNEQIHTEIAKENVLLMKNGLLAKKLKVTGRLRNPYPHGHQGVSTRRMLELYVHDPINEMDEIV